MTTSCLTVEPGSKTFFIVSFLSLLSSPCASILSSKGAKINCGKYFPSFSYNRSTRRLVPPESIITFVKPAPAALSIRICNAGAKPSVIFCSLKVLRFAL